MNISFHLPSNNVANVLVSLTTRWKQLVWPSRFAHPPDLPRGDFPMSQNFDPASPLLRTRPTVVTALDSPFRTQQLDLGELHS